MNVMNCHIFNFLEHSKDFSCHSWSESHFFEHSWGKNESQSERSFLNFKSIFVIGVSA